MNKDEAAKELGVSTRTLNRLQTATGITPTYSKAEKGNYQLADYSVEQVETMRRFMRGESLTPESRPLPPALNGSTALASVTTHNEAIETIDKTAANVALLADPIARAVEKSLESVPSAVADGLKKLARTPKVELTDKMVLSLAEASKLSGIPPRRLKEAIMLDGSMLCSKDDPGLGRGYRIKRLDLIEYVAEF